MCQACNAIGCECDCREGRLETELLTVYSVIRTRCMDCGHLYLHRIAEKLKVMV